MPNFKLFILSSDISVFILNIIMKEYIYYIRNKSYTISFIKDGVL